MLYLRPQKYGRRKTLDVVASSLFSTCDVDITYDNILNLTCCHWFSYTYFHFSQNGLDTIKKSFVRRSAVSIIFVNLWKKITPLNLDWFVSYKLQISYFYFIIFWHSMMHHPSINKVGIRKRMIIVDVTGPHLSRPPLSPNKTVQTCQSKTINNGPILCFWRHFLCPSTPWHTDLTKFQGIFQQRQHLRCIIYSPSWWIGWW